MTKYMLTYIHGPISYPEEPRPGALFEIDRYYTLEQAQVEGRKFKAKYPQHEVIIVPYLSLELSEG